MTLPLVATLVEGLADTNARELRWYLAASAALVCPKAGATAIAS